jgi:hypothetical protein
MMSVAECSAEISMSCYAGALMLQAIGLGGWAFDGMDWTVILGASGDPKIPGFGFRYDTSEWWAVPNITGLPGVFEAYCPPRYRNMSEAVEALAKRNYGPGGVYNEGTAGAWKDSASIRKVFTVHHKISKIVWRSRLSIFMIPMVNFLQLLQAYLPSCICRLIL